MVQKLVLILSILMVFFLGMIITGEAAKKKGHPKIGEMVTEDPQVCVSCHSVQAREWEKGLHGLNQVRCFICHGDLEKRFERVANPSNCVMCHEDKVQDLKKAKKSNCFVCHAGHTLEVKPGSKNIHQK